MAKQVLYYSTKYALRYDDDDKTSHTLPTPPHIYLDPALNQKVTFDFSLPTELIVHVALCSGSRYESHLVRVVF